MKNIYEVLEGLEITYKEFEHPPLFTCKDAKKFWDPVEGKQVKNLFLRNKDKTKLFLMIVSDNKRLDLKSLQKTLEVSRLSFGDAKLLEQTLGVTPGSVSVFSLINDEKNIVQALIEKELLEAPSLLFHPNVNTKTICLSQDGFRKFLSHVGHSVLYVNV